MRKQLREFKQFAIKGKVVDMAVGVILGGAFGRIVTSFVNEILMPLISLFTGRVALAELAFVMPAIDRSAPQVSINYGIFLQNILDFFIIALSIFVMVKLIKRLKRKYFESKSNESPEPTEPPQSSKEEQLLTEIRDMLKEK